ncbi:MAG: SH3 domain-containing protein [Alphaproteobacteria bacterium]|nr:SH3 domain-containing protein [Alphaproteobacteria bacterium]
MWNLFAAVAVSASMGLAFAAGAAPLVAASGASPAIGVHLAQSGGQTAVRVKSAILRAAPDQKSKKITSLRRGTKVQILHASGEWTHVRAGKLEGYIATSLLAAK